MISQEEMDAIADRLTDALTAAAAIMPPDGARALSSAIPGRPASPASGPVQRRTGRLRAWLVPAGAAAIVTAITLTAVTLAGDPGTVPAPGTGPAQAPASAGPGITSLAGVPSDPGTRTPPPPFYVTIVSTGITRDGRELQAVQVRRTSDGRVTGTVPALPAGWTLGRSVSVTTDDRTFTVAAAKIAYCSPSASSRTRFYQFNVTSTGHVTGLRAVGKPVTGEAVREFAASPDGTEVAYAQQGCPAPASAASYAGVIHVMNVTSGAVRSWHNTVSAATPARVTTQIGALSWTANGRTLVADYQWKLAEGPADLAVLGLDATGSGGSLQAHSHLLFSQGDHCIVCVYTALTSADGSTLASPVCAAALLGRRAAQRHLVPLGRLGRLTRRRGTRTSALRRRPGTALVPRAGSRALRLDLRRQAGPAPDKGLSGAAGDWLVTSVQVELIPHAESSERVSGLDHEAARRTGQTVAGFSKDLSIG